MSATAIHQLLPNLYVFQDTCNVYILRHQERGVLIDFGSGRVLDYLSEIGVGRIDWVLHTHHHREQCQGDSILASRGVRIAVPSYEKDLFENPQAHRDHPEKWAVVGAPYVRPLREGVSVDRTFIDGDRFRWGPYDFGVYLRPGNSPGGVCYEVRILGQLVAFCGDLIVSPARLHTYYDSEWDYGYAAGLKAVLDSLRHLRRDDPDLLCPSHGLAVGNVRQQLDALIAKLDRFIPDLLLRGWDTERNATESEAVSAPTHLPGIRRISSHLFKASCLGIGHNFYLLIADSGRGLCVDCGLFRGSQEETCRWLDERLADLGADFGLKGIDAVLVTHYHGDHVLQAPHLVRRHGAEVWAYENFAEILGHPERFNLTCLVPAYHLPFKRIKVHRVLRENEVIDWEGFQLRAFHLPGQTEYACGVAGKIDGRLVCFTGDNLFYSPDRSGHDAFIARNGVDFELGYVKCADILADLKPDLILGGHAQEISDPGPQIERFKAWSRAFEQALRDLSPHPEYEYLIDPQWVKFYPYTTRTRPGKAFRLAVTVTNYKTVPVAVAYELRMPEGWEAEPGRVAIEVAPRSRATQAHRIRVPPRAARRRYALTADIHFGGEHVGEMFDCIVEVR